jgi:tol-pal system protein YbgF
MLLDCAAVGPPGRYPGPEERRRRVDERIMQTQRETIENRRLGGRMPLRTWLDFSRFLRISRLATPVGLTMIGLVSSGCVTQGDFLRLREEVAELHQSGSGGPDPFARIAQLSSEVDAMRQEIRRLEGELELARKESADALVEIRRTRTSLAQQSAAGVVAEPAAVEGTGDAAVTVAAIPAAPDQELVGYQEALDAWRADDYGACIERFTGFLQNYPTSGYADDAAYWLADCTYKNDEFKRAVIRFSDVVRVYPDSPKAPDALYRQGESLLKLGPRFKDAARTVFKRVKADYPDSERATEAAQQLERLGPTG